MSREDLAMNDNRDQRQLDMEDAEVRMEQRGEGDPPKLVGYAAVFNQRSQKLRGGFREIIAPGAFSGVLGKKHDVRILFNHDQDNLLGRTGGRNPNATLTEDERGLRYEVDLMDTTLSRDVATLVENGALTGSSFSFTVDEKGEQWDDDKRERTVTSVSGLYDVGPVTYPAYTGSRVSRRCLDHMEAAERSEADIRLRRLRLED